jgi:hypothetical protein
MDGQQRLGAALLCFTIARLTHRLHLRGYFNDPLLDPIVLKLTGQLGTRLTWNRMLVTTQ